MTSLLRTRREVQLDRTRIGSETEPNFRPVVEVGRANRGSDRGSVEVEAHAIRRSAPVGDSLCASSGHNSSISLRIGSETASIV
jgi:hypothetical protein